MSVRRDLRDPYGLTNGIQIPSAATCKLTLFRGELQLATASGFILEHAKSWHLVTALHNFTGRDFFSRRCISQSLATPDRAQASVRLWCGTKFFNYILTIKLFPNGKPIFWFDWSEDGGDIAVVGLIKEEGGPKLVSLNSSSVGNWISGAGFDAFVLGFPSALDVSGSPIWKKVSIASEPSQRVNGKRIVLTDGLTFKGMSGGPVIINQSHGFSDCGNYVISKEMSTMLLGVYGGRFEADAEKSGSLGFYWPMETVEAIISGRKQLGEIDAV